MEKLWMHFDEVVKDDAEERERAFSNILNGNVSALIPVSAPYSVIKEFVGERINDKRRYRLYAPVKQSEIKAFFVSKEAILDIIRFGEATCQYFNGGVGFEDNGSVIRYVAITRNYIPGRKKAAENKEYFDFEDCEVNKGGVYEEGVFPSAMDLKVTYRKIGHERGGLFEALTRSSKDSCQENDSASNVFHSNFTRWWSFNRTFSCDSPVIGQEREVGLWRQRGLPDLLLGNQVKKGFLSGFNAFSRAFMKCLVDCTNVCGFDAMVLERIEWSFQSLALFLKYEIDFNVPFMMAAKNYGWPPVASRKYWHGFRVLKDDLDEGEFLISESRYGYQLCCFSASAHELEDSENVIYVPKPDFLTIRAKDLHFLSNEYHRLLDPINSNEENEIDLDCLGENCIKSFDDVKGFEECREKAINWICLNADVSIDDLSNAKKIIDYVAIAICTWEKPLINGKANKEYCRQLIHALPKKHPSYSDNLLRLIVLQLQSQSKKAIGKGRELKVRGNGVDMLKKTSLPILIEAWEKFVAGRAKTAKKEKRQERKRALNVFLERHQIKTDYHSAVTDVLLSDQDEEDLFI